MAERTVLVLDDDVSLLSLLRELGYDVITGRNGIEGLSALDQWDGSIDAVVLDIRMPGMDGPAFIQSAAERGYAIPALLLSSNDRVQTIARDLGVEAALSKTLRPGCVPRHGEAVGARRLRISVSAGWKLSMASLLGLPGCSKAASWA